MISVSMLLSIVLVSSAVGLPHRVRYDVSAVPSDVKSLFKAVFNALPDTLAAGLPDEGIPSLSPYTQDIAGVEVDGQNTGTNHLTFDLTDVELEGFSDAQEESYYIYQYGLKKDQYEVDRVMYTPGSLTASYSVTGSLEGHEVTATGELSITSSRVTRTSDMYFTQVTDDSGNVSYEGASIQEVCTLDDPDFTITGLPDGVQSTFQKYYNTVIRDFYCGAISGYVTNDVGELTVIEDMLNSGDYS
jgi:hypothetical protein